MTTLDPVGLSGLVNATGTVFSTTVVALGVAVLVLTFLAERAATGAPSFVSRAADRLARRDGSPVWEPLPLLAALAGLALALVGWRLLDAGTRAAGAGDELLALGLGIACAAGVLGSALAHPPTSMADLAERRLADPVPAHPGLVRRWQLTRRWQLGRGPVGSALVVLGTFAALAGLPLSAIWRALQGRSLAEGAAAPQLLLAGAVVVAAAGIWLLRAESRHAAHGPRRGHDLRESAAAIALLCAGSVALDLGVGPVGWVPFAAVVLMVARVRLGVGGALLVVAGYAATRAAVAAATGTLAAGGVVPALAATLAVAFVAELVGLVGLAGLVMRGQRASTSARS